VTLEGEIDPKPVEVHQQQKADLQEDIEQSEQPVTALKAARKQIKKLITVAELPEGERFDPLSKRQDAIGF
jgi:hypothetical protein